MWGKVSGVVSVLTTESGGKDNGFNFLSRELEARWSGVNVRVSYSEEDN